MDTKKLHSFNEINLKIAGLELISKIGEGGMSVVYLANQIPLNRKIAVKVMHPEVIKNNVEVQRFKHEARTIAHLEHPNIVDIYNIGQTKTGEIYFTMPYLSNGNFSSYKFEDEQKFIYLIKSICGGLAFAHSRGIVHCDIKPANLLFDKFGNIQIADFGIAISKNSDDITKEHQIIGSAKYISPEQARSLKVDVRSDIYSLGVVIYEKLTGKVPFASDGGISVLVDHINQEPATLPTKMHHWQELIDKCLAKSPKNRFQSIAELQVALDNVPTNSLQRTSAEVQNVLSSRVNKHLKWFIPVILFIFIAVFFIINQSMRDTSITNATVVNATATDSEISTNDSITSLTSIEVESITSKQASTLNATAKEEKIQQLLAIANTNIARHRLSKPDNNNAISQLLAILKISPNNPEAIIGLEKVATEYFKLTRDSLKRYDFNTASKHARALKSFNNETNFVNKNFARQQKALLEIITKFNLSNKKFTANRIKYLTRVVKEVAPNHQLIGKLSRQRKLKLSLQIGTKLVDEMGIETIMLSKNLAAGLTEISVGSYAKFSDATNRVTSRCNHKGWSFKNIFAAKKWNKPYFAQTQNHPVVCVSQADASAYAKWLSGQTDNKYRLPNKQEWLMLAALAESKFSACKSANLAGQESKKVYKNTDKFACNDKHAFTAPVTTFTKNKSGLYGVGGNVSEWLACTQTPCKSSLSMGDSWYHGKPLKRTAQTVKHRNNSAYSYIGFRLVRDL